MKKRVAQLAFYGVYCVLALIGLLLDFGVFGGGISTRPFVYYTSLSNMLCSAFIAISLVRTLAHREVESWQRGKYVFVVMILVTAIVYNLLLNPYSSLLAYFSSVKNALYHLVLPVMFVLDWIFFYRRGTVKPHDPLVAAIIPLVYVIYILVRAFAVKSAGITVSVLYPYFFLNVDRLGWHSFILWMGALLVMLLLLGYGLYGLDRLLNRKTLRKKKIPETSAR